MHTNILTVAFGIRTKGHQLQERLHIAKTSHRIIEKNGIALNAIAGGATLLENLDDQEITAKYPLETGQLLESSKGFILKLDIQDQNGNPIKRIWLEETCTNQEKEEYIQHIQEESADALIGFQTLSDIYENAAEEGYLDILQDTYDFKRIEDFKGTERLMQSLNATEIQKLGEIIFYDEELPKRNWERLKAELEPIKQFELRANVVPQWYHYSFKKLEGESFHSSDKLAELEYPEGSAEHVLETIKTANSTEAARLINGYYYGGNQNELSTISEGSYPIKASTKAWDVAFGFENSVFLTQHHGHGQEARRMKYLEYRFPNTKISELNHLVIPAYFPVIIEYTHLRKTSGTESIFNKTNKSDTDTIRKAFELFSNQILDANRYQQFYKAYIEAVFDSEESFWEFHQKITSTDERSPEVEAFKFDQMSESEKERAKYLAQETGILPPFISELIVHRQLNIELGDKPKNQILTNENGEEIEVMQLNAAMGSNPGGLYVETTPIGEIKKRYIKFYDNPEQSRLEWFANSIYKKVGIATPETTLIQMNNTLGLSLGYLEDNSRTNARDLSLNEQFLAGFVCDCFLENWDVLGENCQNVLTNDLGVVYRVDNGVSLAKARKTTLHDMGEEKNFLQLFETFQTQETNTAFAGLTPEDLAKQARYLLKVVTPEFIERLIDEAQFENTDTAEYLTKTLLEKLEYLETHYAQDTN